MNMKRFIRHIVAVVSIAALAALLFGFSSAASTVTATPTTSSVLVNGKNVAFQAYNIGDNNYFKLRDIAMALSGTTKHFSVNWNAEAASILLSSSGYYVPIGGELTVSDSESNVTAVSATAKVTLNGKQINLTAYNIGGYNYFKLRDIGASLDFAITYDCRTGAITIDTLKQYYISALMNLLEGENKQDAFYDAASGVLNYYGMDSGFMSITKYNESYFCINANVYSDHDYAILQSVVGIFVDTPSQVISALKASAAEGRKTFQLNGKTITCFMLGQNQTIEINWS